MLKFFMWKICVHVYIFVKERYVLLLLLFHVNIKDLIIFSALTLKELKEYHKIHHSAKPWDFKIRCGNKDFRCGDKSRLGRCGAKSRWTRATARVWDHPLRYWCFLLIIRKVDIPFHTSSKVEEKHEKLRAQLGTLSWKKI